jgi:hypothetical protein
MYGMSEGFVGGILSLRGKNIDAVRNLLRT